MGWFSSNSILTYKDVNEYLFIPKATDVYKHMISGAHEDERFDSLLNDIQGIRFSKIAVIPRIQFSMNGEKIECRLYCIRKGKRIDLLFSAQGGADHYLDGNTWFFLSSDFLLAEELIRRAEIDNPSDVLFSSYIRLLDLKKEYTSLIIDDEVANSIKQEGEMLYARVPDTLNAQLYPYQTTGFRWLKYITDSNCGCLLGDEMGLGKTMQVITLLLDRQGKAKTPALVVAPVSLLENWRRELQHFAPGLSVLIHHGTRRTGRYSVLMTYDVVVTAYGTVTNDLSMFEMVEWDLLVLDEAQNIKTPTAARTVSAKQLRRRAGIAVTGTPFENHITDLWSILDFAMPGCLGMKDDFEKQYPDDVSGAEKIEPFLTALMIRRRVDEVAKDLPERVTISQPIRMGDREALLYEEERQKILENSNRETATLAILTKLRMYCTHPFLLEDNMPEKDPASVSTKYTRLCEIIDEIVNNSEKIILFTSYTGMFQILEKDIAVRFNIPVLKINGETPVEERQSIIDSFSSMDGSALLVLNPRAAGVGLNITAANHVIHYNLEWNPALEDQATARAFRRGQTKTVFVHRLFYSDTVEEVVDEKISHKRSMSDVAVVGTTGESGNRELILKALETSPLGKEISE